MIGSVDWRDPVRDSIFEKGLFTAVCFIQLKNFFGNYLRFLTFNDIKKNKQEMKTGLENYH